MQTKETGDQVKPSRRVSRRHRRAEALRRRALSPLRIVFMVLALPVTTAMIAIGVYMRVSEFDRPHAVIHLLALAGCDVALAVGVGPFRIGEPGYHRRNDPDGDGVACGAFVQPEPTRPTRQQSAQPKQRMVGSAKFVKP